MSVDSGPDSVEHKRLGVWNVYVAKPDTISGFSFLQTFDEALKALPYVIRAVQVLVLLCYKALLIYITSGLIISVLPATSLYYSGQLLQVVQDSIDSRSVDKRLLIRVLFLESVPCIVSKMRTHYAEHILRAHIRLDVPTYNDPAVQGQLRSAVGSRSNVAWSCIRTLITVLSAVIQLLTQVSVLISVLKDQPDGAVLALLSFAQPVLSWVRRSSAFPPGVWAAATRNQDYIRLEGIKKLVAGEEYHKELVTSNLHDYLVSEFRAIQQRLGEDGDLDYYSLWRLMRERQETLSLSSLLQNSLHELPQLAFTLRAIQSPRSIPVSLASLTLIRDAVSSFSAPLAMILRETSSMSETFASIGRLYEIVNIKNQVVDGHQPYPEDTQAVSNGMTIEFINVSFKYPGSSSYAIINVSFKIEPGQLCVLVGFNGSGKSTIFKLLNRLYDPTEGRILVDGHDIKTLKLADLRRCISVLFQDYTHFPLSIKENIGMGDPEHAWDEDRVRQAAELSGASDIISNLSEGFDTVLSPPLDFYSGASEGRHKAQYEGLKLFIGRAQDPKLSGGQMQKLALSRTFMRSLEVNSSVGLLLFDEPSASLDPVAEHDLFERLRRLRGNRTMIFSSHRFGQLTKSADLILYMANSTVVESGTHESLLERNGGYSKMYNIQAAHFK
ncbi:P-loop containing nucleoside triphosphate hydrolase protein [Gautieria morchelliformis]|nr:P-loop containing nucleoside triphosphate hydrolase protein [Gautieria morchelliformis]